MSKDESGLDLLKLLREEHERRISDINSQEKWRIIILGVAVALLLLAPLLFL